MLFARGAEVVALSRTQADLDSLHAEIGCQTLMAALADIPAAVAAVQAALPLDLLVNNAGISVLRPVLETTTEEMENALRVNTLAPLALAQTFAADLIRRGARGAVVNVSSNAAARGLRDHAAYCASKAALDALTRVLATELGPHGIRVNSVNPSVTLTPMGIRVWSAPEKADPVLARIPLGRFLQPEEVASAICFLLDDDAAMVNGVCLPADGGFAVS
jgi:NAD(P)-dependent dehydrogenase (short-subunit alcohol dehydrogenase family)